MNGFRAFLKRKNIEFSAKRYGVDALGAMAQGLFCTLLVGTILNTLGTQFHIGFLSATVVTVGTGETATAYTIGGLASAMVGPAMAVAIGSALQAPPLVLFSLVPVGFATNILGWNMRWRTARPIFWAERAALWLFWSSPLLPLSAARPSRRKPRSTFS